MGPRQHLVATIPLVCSLGLADGDKCTNKVPRRPYSRVLVESTETLKYDTSIEASIFSAGAKGKDIDSAMILDRGCVLKASI